MVCVEGVTQTECEGQHRGAEQPGVSGGVGGHEAEPEDVQPGDEREHRRQAGALASVQLVEEAHAWSLQEKVTNDRITRLLGQ